MEELTARQFAVIRFCFSCLFPLPFIIVGALLLHAGIREIINARQSVSWPRADGVVLSSEIKTRSSARGPSQSYLEVRYEYSVNGAPYADYFQRQSAAATAAKYAKGTRLPIRYKPGRPEVSVIETGLNPRLFLTPGGGLAFLVAGLLALAVIPRAMAKAYPPGGSARGQAPLAPGG